MLLSHRNRRSGGGQRGLGVFVERIRTSYEGKKIGLYFSSPLLDIGVFLECGMGLCLLQSLMEGGKGAPFPRGASAASTVSSFLTDGLSVPGCSAGVSCYHALFSSPPSGVGTL